ncbi:MAG: DUF2062 domain-containing protein [Nitrospirae bacterium]|nr:DUF2062 domain-containing protein [Nitrospirota bacterium]
MHFRDRLRQILSIKESPHRIAVAFAIGVFIGMSPLLGIHTVLGIAVSWMFKLNRIVTLIGVFITNPWTIVPIYTFGTWLGARLMQIDHIMPDIDWSHISMLGLIREFRPLLMPFVVGNTLLGVVSAVLGYLVIYKAVKRSRG